MKNKQMIFNKHITYHSKQNNMKKKDMYVSPQVELIELETESMVMTGSVTTGGITLPGTGDGGSAYSVSSSHATQSDIESLLDDILTIEQ